MTINPKVVDNIARLTKHYPRSTLYIMIVVTFTLVLQFAELLKG